MDDEVKTHRVQLRNVGLSPRVFYDDARVVRVAPRETVDETLREDTIARLKAEQHVNPDYEPPPLEVTELGEAGSSDGGGGPTSHKRRPAPTG